MSDLFNEIDEEVRRDKVLDFWMRHRNGLIALAVLIVLGTAGYTSWQKHVRAKAEATAARFEAAIYARDAHELPLQILFGHAQVALTAADAALVASG
jgi:hypothetical protein